MNLQFVAALSVCGVLTWRTMRNGRHVSDQRFILHAHSQGLYPGVNQFALGLASGWLRG
jgi:hypothetical protein